MKSALSNVVSKKCKGHACVQNVPTSRPAKFSWEILCNFDIFSAHFSAAKFELLMQMNKIFTVTYTVRLGVDTKKGLSLN